jgi:hypothetical protein
MLLMMEMVLIQLLLQCRSTMNHQMTVVPTEENPVPRNHGKCIMVEGPFPRNNGKNDVNSTGPSCPSMVGQGITNADGLQDVHRDVV